MQRNFHPARDGMNKSTTQRNTTDDGINSTAENINIAKQKKNTPRSHRYRYYRPERASDNELQHIFIPPASSLGMTIRVLFVCNLASPAGAASGEREENTSCPPRWTDIAFGQPGDTKRRRLVITLTIVRRGLNLFVPFVAALTVQRIELGHVFFICMACFARGWDGFLLHHRYYYYYYFYWKPCNFHRLSHSVVIFNPLLGSHCHLEICRTATCVISIHRAT